MAPGTYEGEVTLNTNVGSMVFTVTMIVIEYVSTEGETVPLIFSVSDNYPNPFNPETWIPYQLAQTAEVTISIYNYKYLQNLD